MLFFISTAMHTEDDIDSIGFFYDFLLIIFLIGFLVSVIVFFKLVREGNQKTSSKCTY